MIEKEVLASPCNVTWQEGAITFLKGNIELGYTSRYWGNAQKKTSFTKPFIKRYFCQPQSHSNTIEKIPLEREVKFFDGSFTQESQCQISGRFADCLPVYIGSFSGEWLALVHSGWKGSLSGIVSSMIGIFKDQLKVPASQIWAILGPYRGWQYYEVSHSFKEAFISSWKSSWVKDCFEREEEKYFFDNGIFTLLLLKELGLKDLSFFPVDMGIDERFYSHRRAEKERNLAFIHKIGDE